VNERQSIRLFAAPLPLVEEARERLTRESCPRRYCWYWDTLGFDWELSAEQGCRVADEHPGDDLLVRAGATVQPWRRCCRATGNPQHRDFYEPREPHLEADGWPVDFFDLVGKAARTRRFERRERGERRRDE
jgi:hypothetical protein